MIKGRAYGAAFFVSLKLRPRPWRGPFFACVAEALSLRRAAYEVGQPAELELGGLKTHSDWRGRV